MCYNLPCSMCRKHATNYISRVRLDEINTKSKLIDYLYKFHNFVNSRLGKPYYAKDHLVKYNRLKMKQCYRLVHRSFNLQYYGLFDGWQRKQGIQITTKYLTSIWSNIN